MDVVLVPGFWLTGGSWSPVTAALDAAGHVPHPLTLPGRGPGESAAGVGLGTHVDAVVAVLDALDGAAVLVGHSGGGVVAYGALDARPDRVAGVVPVDSGPLADGGVVNDALPVVGDVVPLPGRSAFPDGDLVGMTGELWERFAESAVPEPAGVASGPLHLHDERRLDVPAVVVACTTSEEALRELLAQGHPYVAELARLTSVRVVDLPTGHWPQLTEPEALAAAVLDAVASFGGG